MTTLIAILALCISLSLLIVHYCNQVERRHGEISKLRSDFLQSLSDTHHRWISVQLHLETLRLELRRMRECEDKYNYIETMPSIIERSKVIGRKLEQIQSSLEHLDTAKRNKGKVLIALQSIAHDIHTLDDILSEHEQDILKVLEIIRAEQDKEDGQFIEKGKNEESKLHIPFFEIQT